jgi:aminoglycoside phosphotransferase family enzyme
MCGVKNVDLLFAGRVYKIKKPKTLGITDHTALTADLKCFISRFY